MRLAFPRDDDRTPEIHVARAAEVADVLIEVSEPTHRGGDPLLQGVGRGKAHRVGVERLEPIHCGMALHRLETVAELRHGLVADLAHA